MYLMRCVNNIYIYIFWVNIQVNEHEQNISTNWISYVCHIIINIQMVSIKCRTGKFIRKYICQLIDSFTLNCINLHISLTISIQKISKMKRKINEKKNNDENSKQKNKVWWIGTVEFELWIVETKNQKKKIFF